MPIVALPDRIDSGRLVLLRWSPKHALLLKAAVDANLEHLQAWMPWATSEPTPLAELHLRLARFREDFDAGHSWLYGIFPPDESSVLGGLGLHPRPDQSSGSIAIEIGYWLRADVTGHGYATEAVVAATGMATRLPGVSGLEIRCDPGNTRSAAVALRAGFQHVTTLSGNAVSPSGQPRDTMVWRLAGKP